MDISEQSASGKRRNQSVLHSVFKRAQYQEWRPISVMIPREFDLVKRYKSARMVQIDAGTGGHLSSYSLETKEPRLPPPTKTTCSAQIRLRALTNDDTEPFRIGNLDKACCSIRHNVLVLRQTLVNRLKRHIAWCEDRLMG